MLGREVLHEAFEKVTFKLNPSGTTLRKIQERTIQLMEYSDKSPLRWKECSRIWEPEEGQSGQMTESLVARVQMTQCCQPGQEIDFF